jgi:hypothetical protein
MFETTFPGEAGPRQIEGHLESAPGLLSTGQQIKLRVNRDEPSLFTDRVDPRPWAAELWPAMLVLPLVVVMSLLWKLRTDAVVRVYKSGETARGTVITAARSPLSPGAKVLTVANSVLSHPVKVAWPDALGPIREEDPIDLIVNARGRAAIAARAYPPRDVSDIDESEPDLA